MSDRLRELEIGFTRLEATLTTKLDQLTHTLQPRHEDVEARLRVLEQWRWLMTGAAMAVGGAAGSVAGFLVNGGGP